MNNILKVKLSSKYVISGILTSLCAPAIAYGISLIKGINITLPFLIIVYLLPLTIYFFDFSAENKSRKLIYFLFPFVLILFFVWEYSSLSFFSLYVFIFILALLYPVLFKGITRHVSLFKDIFVALIWASLILMLFDFYNAVFTFDIVILLVFVFLRTFIDISYCDIKDIETDKKYGLKTLPVLFGADRTIKVLQILNVITLLFISYFSLIGILPKLSISLAIPIVISILSIAIYSKKFDFSTLIVDSEYIFWVIAPLLIKALWKQ